MSPRGCAGTLNKVIGKANNGGKKGAKAQNKQTSQKQKGPSKQSEAWPAKPLSTTDIDTIFGVHMPEVGEEGREHAEEEMRGVIEQLSQPNLKTSFGQIYKNRVPKSNNNEWMRKRLREVCGCQTQQAEESGAEEKAKKGFPNKRAPDPEPALAPSTPRQSPRLQLREQVAKMARVTVAKAVEDVPKLEKLTELVVVSSVLQTNRSSQQYARQTDHSMQLKAPADTLPGPGGVDAPNDQRALLGAYNTSLERARASTPSAGAQLGSNMGMVAMPPFEFPIELSAPSVYPYVQQTDFNFMASPEYQASLAMEAARLGVGLPLQFDDHLPLASSLHDAAAEFAAEIAAMDPHCALISDLYDMLPVA